MKRLVPRHSVRHHLPTTPLANLALLVLACVMITGMSAASRGPGLRFAVASGSWSFDDRGAIRVEVASETDVTVDGSPAPPGGLTALVTAHLDGRPDGAVVLAVSPDATYQAMLSAYAAVVAAPGPPRVALVARARTEAM